MKTKLILAAIILGAIVYSCIEREEQTMKDQTYSVEKKTINNDGEEASGNSSKVSDTVRTKDLLDGINSQQTQPDPNPGPTDNTGETVNPGSLGTPPTRP